MRMALTKQKFTSYLKAADFRTLFIEEMGWNKISANFATLPTFYVDEKPFDIKAIAQRNGFQILVCSIKEVPSNSTCKKLDTKLRKAANDYICIFVVPGTEHHQWIAPVKTNEKRDIVIIEYTEADKAQFLYEKIAGLSFDIDETTTIVDVKERVQGAFAINSEKITKDFYVGFSKEHKAFAEFITGIDDQTATKDNKNKQWYTSVMLNRLMFCYFIQKKGFLNGDENYLSNKLHWVQTKKGKNQFFKTFYKGFLIQLFHDGLNSPKHDDTFEEIYGRIPYLNGGMFDIHQIERDYSNIDIKDEAFESLFDFFDKWRWHLDSRVTASGRDINPDVLGYIFEQYINDRAQMGAYYTKEDITEYIGRNTIIPFLIDSVAKRYPSAFSENGPFWSFIRNSGDVFIYDAVKKGVHEAIPEDIAQGIDADAPHLLERRKNWNNPSQANIGLPTEIWRETIERRQRYNDIVSKVNNGEIKSVNDFVTFNLNTPKIAYDFLNTTEDKKIIEVFYDELLKVTVLDPTCGSGAFLFAALNLLEPLYEICISRMQDFNDADHHSFNEQLSEIQNKYRSNIQYFIYKSIILRNLYGVDIMAEAIEIAKLRLFLKMVAVVDVDKRADNMGLDPLPDVDFNIRCGNTLVGYSTEEQLYHDLDNASDFLQQLANQELKEQLQDKLNDVADTYEIFRLEQLSKEADVSVLKQAKHSLNKELSTLNELLNKHLFASSGQSDYAKWLTTHQPFHWLAEFYLILHDKGGFSAICGNPPYVEYSKVKKYYTLDNYYTCGCGNLYANVFERCLHITDDSSRIGMIVQLPIVCTSRMQEAQNLLNQKTSWLATFDDRPGKLFDKLEHIRATIFITTGSTPQLLSTKYNRWYSECRPFIFQNQSFYPTQAFEGTFPKIGGRLWESVQNKILKHKPLSRLIGGKVPNIYYHNAPQYFTRFTDFIPFFKDGEGNQVISSHVKTISLSNSEYAPIIMAILNSSLFYWFFVLRSNCRDLSSREIETFPIDISSVNPQNAKLLKDLGKALSADFQRNAYRKIANYKATGQVQYDEYYPKLSKTIIDKIDAALASIYGFSEEELDFILNYDIKYRMGDELAEE